MTRLLGPLLRIAQAKFITDADITCDIYRERSEFKNRLQCAIAMLLGLLIALGGTERWARQSLEVAMAFPGASSVLGVTLMFFGVVTACGIFAHNAKLLVFGLWGSTVWAWLMFVFSLFKLAAAPGTVDNIAWVLWLYLGLDFLVNAQSHLAWTHE